MFAASRMIIVRSAPSRRMKRLTCPDDHLDYSTILDLWKHHSETVHFLVPLGLRAWFEACDIPSDRVTELDWWSETILSFPSSSSPISPILSPSHHVHSLNGDSPPSSSLSPDLSSSILSLKIAFTPAQHRSGRGVLDHMTTLWGSWCVGVIDHSDRHRAFEPGMAAPWAGFKAYFAGDTGYRYATAPDLDDSAVCPAFAQIAERYSPFNLSLLPIATGSSLPFLRTILSLSLDQYTLTSALHCSARDALELHRVLKSERSVGVHWGTFCDADEARGTRVDFGRSRRAIGVSGQWASEDKVLGESKGRFVLADIGETLLFPTRG